MGILNLLLGVQSGLILMYLLLDFICSFIHLIQYLHLPSTKNRKVKTRKFNKPGKFKF